MSVGVGGGNAPDLSVIFLTTNRHPGHWSAFHLTTLLRATRGFPLITVSRIPMELGTNIVDTQPQSHFNMYKQLLVACKLATTPYIATAEDDVLYTRTHFTFYRPPLDTIAYDMSRWSLYWWEPVYSVKQRISNCTLIAPREEYIEALEERLEKMSPDRPELVSEVGRYEPNLGVSPRKIERVYGPDPVVHFNAPASTDHIAKDGRKRLGQLKAYDIPGWGKAEDLLKEYR